MNKVLVGALVGGAVLLIGLVAIVWGVARGVGEAADRVIDDANSELHGGKASPTSVEVGEEFTHGDWKVSAGWKVTRDALGRADVTADVTNVGTTGRASLLTFKFMRGNRVLASTECTTDQLDPGQLASLDCFASGDLPSAYDGIQVTALF